MYKNILFLFHLIEEEEEKESVCVCLKQNKWKIQSKGKEIVIFFLFFSNIISLIFQIIELNLLVYVLMVLILLHVVVVLLL